MDHSSYAVAAQTQRVVIYKPNSTIVDNEVNLALYDRYVLFSVTWHINACSSNENWIISELSDLVTYLLLTSSYLFPSFRPTFLWVLRYGIHFDWFFCWVCPSLNLPFSLQVTFKEHEKADEDYRYIPDILLKQKQEELKSLDDPVVRRNLGWE